MKVINLTPAELLVAVHRAGVIRGVKALQHGRGQVENRRVSGLDDFGIHYVGMLGEVAVAKFLGALVRDDITRYGDGMVDMDYRGASLQIKTSTHSALRERLAFINRMEELTSDWLVVCSVQGPAAIGLHGFISRRKFAAKKFEHDFGYGVRLCVRETDLAPMEMLDEAIGVKAAA